jgi:3-oxoacyl-[acyl-carrier protein] reductase
MNELRERTIVITGAAGGIGTAIARMADQEGARLLLVDPNEKALAEIVHSLGGKKHVPVASFLDSPDECARVLAKIDGPIYGLVHMAGIFVPHELTPAARKTYDQTIAANMTNAFDLVCAMNDRLTGDVPARIVLATSQAYRRGSLGHVAYSMAKGGIAGLVRALARNFRARALVNGVAPGVIDTGMPAHILAVRREDILKEIPLGRLGRPEEVAGVVMFLLGPLSTYVTGQIINIDGGTNNS